jgi:drug/metabolite transporter (DMT)-like permease
MDENLSEVLMPLSIMGGLGGASYLFVTAITEYILKKKMIDKGYVNEDTQAIFKRHADENKYSALKWGLIVLFGGLSLILLEFIPTNPESPLPYGLVAFFLSLGFLIYYYIVKKESNKIK